MGTDPLYVDVLQRQLVRAGPALRAVAEDRPLLPAVTFFDSAVDAVIERAVDEAELTENEKTRRRGDRFGPAKVEGGLPIAYRPPSTTNLEAGPLAGIWASGPSLHNGSVASIYEMLSPESERRAIFWTGGRELDRERLGFVSDAAPGLFRFDTALPGNRNTGHHYPPAGLSPGERKALIEYLKTS